MKQLPFSVNEYRCRIDKAIQAIQNTKLDALIITKPENMYYLAGYNTELAYRYQALIISARADLILIIQNLEEENARNTSWIDDIRPYFDDVGLERRLGPIELTQNILQELKLEDKNIGVEKDTITGIFTPLLFDELRNSLPFAEFHDASNLVGEIRLVKSDQEIEYMKKAAAICIEGIRGGLKTIEKGVYEHEIAAAIYYSLFKNGCERLSLPVFFGSGPRTSLGHSTPIDRKIKEGDLICYEAEGVYKRYHYNMLRMASIGEPSNKVKRAYKTALEALYVLQKNMKPGNRAEELDKAAMEIYTREGFTNPIRSGYSSGIEYPPTWTLEPLSLKEGDRHLLKQNMVIDLQATILSPPDFGIKLGGDGHAVTTNGCKPLSDAALKGEVGWELQIK